MSEQTFDPVDPGDAGAHLIPGYAAAATLYGPVSHLAQQHHGVLFGGALTADAAQFQAQTAGIAASARISGQSISGLRGEVRALAAEFPVGIAGARQYVGIVQELGVTSAGSVPRVGQLSKVLIELNAATGTGPALALGFGQLNRQLASLDPVRLRRMADAVVYLQAKGGGSAEGIVGFARQIAPFAQQAGIGETAVLGIASSFSKLGDEGNSAGTAVSRVLGDISRSVKTGSNDIAAYADAVGLTVKQFRELYQANPVGALERVVGALGNGGGRAAYLLEQRGLDGVRSQRALLQLAQSGGLAEQISLAQTGYGSDATHKAAAAAFDNLDAQLQKVKSTAGEVGAAFGGPVARGLTGVLRIAETPLHAGAGVLNSRAGQDVLTAGTGLAIAGLVGTKLFSKLGPLALGTELIRSGPVAAAVGGLRMGNGRGPFDEGSFRGRAYNSTMAAAGQRSAGEPIGTGPLAGLRGSIYDFTYGVGAARQADLSVARESIVARYARRGTTLASGALAGYANLARMPFHLAFTPAEDRAFALTRPGGVTRAFGTEISTALRARDYAAARKALHEFETSVGGTGKAVGRVGTAFGRAALDLTTFTARGGYGAVRGIGGGLLGAAGGFLTSGTGLALAGIAGYSVYQGVKNANQRNYDVSNLGIFDALNKYRDSLGLAGEAATTFADQAKQAAAALGQHTGGTPTTLAAAKTISGTQIAAVGTPDRKKAKNIYRGSDAQIAAQIEALNLNGLSPADVSAVGTDLLQQGISPDRANRILAQVNAGGSGGQLTAGIIAGSVGGAAVASASYSPSVLETLGRGASALTHVDEETSGRRTIGKGTSQALIGKDGKAIIDRLISAMGQQFGNDAAHGGPLYAMQNKLRNANQIQAFADASGDYDLIVYTAKKLSAAISDNGKAVSLTAADVLDSGGNVVALANAGGRKFGGQTLSQLQGQGVTLSGRGVAPVAQGSPFATSIAAIAGSGVTGRVLAGTAGGARTAGLVETARDLPNDTEATTKAVYASAIAAEKAGASFDKVANEANRVAAGLGEQAGKDYEIARGVAAFAQLQQSARLPFLSPGKQVASQFRTYSSLTAETGPGAAQDVATGRQGLVDLRNGLADQYRARLMAQFSYQVAAGRAREDFQRQTTRSTEDYQRQLLYSEQDYQRSRTRSIRDFNINVRRESEDLATGAYDPYQRIQVRPVWDAFNLLGNAQEQLTAMRTQVKNINKLKALGLSDAAIRQLGLYNPANAQEAAELVDDLSGNKGLVRQFDAEASARDRVGGQLLSADPSFKRQREDYRKQLRDAQADQTRATDRMHTEFELGLSRAAQDQQIGLRRMAEDLHNADLQITDSFEQLQKDMLKVLNGGQLNFSHKLINGLQDTLTTIRGFGPAFTNAYSFLAPGGGSGGSGPTGSYGSVNLSGGVAGGGVGDLPVGTGGRTASGDPIKAYVKPGTGTVYTGGYRSTGTGKYDYRPSDEFMRDHPAQPAYNKSIAKSMKPGWSRGAEWDAWNALWTNESGWNQYADNPTSDAYGIPQSLPGTKMSTAGKDWQTNPATQIRWGIGAIARTYGDPVRAMAHENRFGWYGAGGIATRPHVGVVAERGVAEAMIPLDPRGVKVLTAAIRQYIGEDDSRMILSGGRAAGVLIHHEEHHYDQRVDLTGAEVTVVSDDPNDMGRKLAAKTRRDNLTGARGVRWSRTPGSAP